ncbi:MAG TPA: threonine/serine dehydratase [Thermoanaerobaculia bacterium]|nr:threonine/serine dehydratase [Thermoanaerobaculia bacterium]
MIALSRIRDAAARIAGNVHRTPLLSAAGLGSRFGASLYLKCESLQKTGSFKPRGALNKVLSLSPEERARGLVTVSAGNHAQAVAWAARIAGAACTVVMPSGAPTSKIEATRGYGAEIVLHDDRATLFDRLAEVRDSRGLSFVHPFDDAEVIAGAGTTGLEILEDLPDADVIVVPIGGGGILSGIASAARPVRPGVRLVGVELEEGPGMAPALAAGKPVKVTRPWNTVADGMTPPFVGALTLEIVREAVDDVVGISESAIVEAMKLLMTRAKLYVEGAGAAATAALLDGKVRVPPGAKVVALISGGNVDLADYRSSAR